MELRRLVDPQHPSKTSTKKSPTCRKPLRSACQLLWTVRQHAVVHAGMRVVWRDLDIRDGDETQPGILDLETDQVREVSLDLVRNPLATIAVLR
jgi:hypothetical protein